MNLLVKLLYKKGLVRFSADTYDVWKEKGLIRNFIFIVKHSLFSKRMEMILYLLHFEKDDEARKILFELVDDPIQIVSAKAIEGLMRTELSTQESSKLESKLKFWKIRNKEEKHWAKIPRHGNVFVDQDSSYSSRKMDASIGFGMMDVF
ncbi:hypothetical protein [Aureibacter tunicatorum]|uniref:Uncharacterized protein n=1 Tax=Aureibacter tunicatorum TaxID=866807 RepID=A0AAE3XRD0_9BACT|nr:hypothetical protein [Aureibacter tunicatorum]MDR6240614.1 hypothetical protein [Aureibacter tunicatorum]